MDIWAEWRSEPLTRHSRGEVCVMYVIYNALLLQSNVKLGLLQQSILSSYFSLQVSVK